MDCRLAHSLSARRRRHGHDGHDAAAGVPLRGFLPVLPRFHAGGVQAGAPTQQLPDIQPPIRTHDAATHTPLPVATAAPPSESTLSGGCRQIISQRADSD